MEQILDKIKQIFNINKTEEEDKTDDLLDKVEESPNDEEGF